MRREDRLPELTDYEDTGCRFHDKCLTCPFSYCIEDGVQSHRRSRGRSLAVPQRAELRRLVAAGWPTAAIAAAVGCSRQAVSVVRRAMTEHVA